MQGEARSSVVLQAMHVAKQRPMERAGAREGSGTSTRSWLEAAWRDQMQLRCVEAEVRRNSTNEALYFCDHHLLVRLDVLELRSIQQDIAGHEEPWSQRPNNSRNLPTNCQNRIRISSFQWYPSSLPVLRVLRPSTHNCRAPSQDSRDRQELVTQLTNIRTGQTRTGEWKLELTPRLTGYVCHRTTGVQSRVGAPPEQKETGNQSLELVSAQGSAACPVAIFPQP